MQIETQMNAMTKFLIFGVVLTLIAGVLGLYHNSDGWIQETACYGSDHRCSKFKLSCPAENRIILGQMQYAFKFRDECVFGVSNCDQNPMMCCKYSEGDKLLSYWENDTYVARRLCSAKQSCKLHVPWIGTGLVISSYVRLSYRCAAVKSIIDMCSSVIAQAKDLYLMFNGSAQPSPDELMGTKNCQCKISTSNCVSNLRISYTDIRVLRVNKDTAGKRCSSASLVRSSSRTMVACDPGNLPLREPTDADVLNSYQETLTLRSLRKHGENDVPEFLLLSVTAENYESEVKVACNMPESIQQRFDACRSNKIQEASTTRQESEDPSQNGDGKFSWNIKQDTSWKSAKVDKIGRFNATRRRRPGIIGQSESHGGDGKTSVLVAEVGSGKRFHIQATTFQNELPRGQEYKQFYDVDFHTQISEAEVVERQRGQDEILNKGNRKVKDDSKLDSISERQSSTHFARTQRTFTVVPALQKRETDEPTGRHVDLKYVENEKDESSKTRENEKDILLTYTSLSTFHASDSGQQESTSPYIQESTPGPLSSKVLRNDGQKVKVESSGPTSSFSSRPSSTYLLSNFKNPATTLELDTEEYVDGVTVFGEEKDHNASNPESENQKGGPFITSNRTKKEQSFYEHVTDSSKMFVSSVTHESKLSGIEDVKVNSMKNNLKTVDFTRGGDLNVDVISVAATAVKKENSNFENASELIVQNAYGKGSDVNINKGIAVADRNKSVKDETLSGFSNTVAYSSSVQVEEKADAIEIQKHSDGLQESATRKQGADDCSIKEMLSFSQSTEFPSTESSVSVVRHSEDGKMFNKDGHFSSKINEHTTSKVAIKKHRPAESKRPCSQMTTEDFRSDALQHTDADISTEEITKEINLSTGDHESRSSILSRLLSSSFPTSPNLYVPCSWTSPIYSSKIEFRDSKETVTMPNRIINEIRRSKARASEKRTESSNDRTRFLDEVKDKEMAKLFEINDPPARQKLSNKKLYHNHPLQRKMKTKAGITTTEASLSTLAGDKSEFTGEVSMLSSSAQMAKGRINDDGKIKTSVTPSSTLFSSTIETSGLNELVSEKMSRLSMPKTSSGTRAIEKRDGKDALDDQSTWETTSVGITKYIVKKSNAENTLRDVDTSSSFFTSESMPTIISTKDSTSRMARSFSHSSSWRSFPNMRIRTNDSNKIATYVEKNSDENSRANERVSENASNYLKTATTAQKLAKIEDNTGSIGRRPSSPSGRIFGVDNSTIPETKFERPESDASETLRPTHELAPSVKIATETPRKENPRNSLSNNEKPFRDLDQEKKSSLLTIGESEDESLTGHLRHTPQHQRLSDEDPCAEVGGPIINKTSSVGKERFLTNLNCTKARSAPLTQKVPLGGEIISTTLRKASSLRVSARKEHLKSDTTELMWASLSFIQGHRGSDSNRGSATLSQMISLKNETIESQSQHQSKHSLQSTGASSTNPNKITPKEEEKEAGDNSSVNVLAADIGPHAILVQHPFDTLTEAEPIEPGTQLSSTFHSAIQTETPKKQTSYVDSRSLDIGAVASLPANESQLDSKQREHALQKSGNKEDPGSNAKIQLATEESSAKDLNTWRRSVPDFAIWNTPATAKKKTSKNNEDSAKRIAKEKAKDDGPQGQSDLPSNASSSKVSVINDNTEKKAMEVPPSAGLGKITASTERKQLGTKIVHTTRKEGNGEESSKTKENDQVAETPDILNEKDGEIIATEVENAKVIGKVETLKMEMAEGKEEINIEKTDFNITTKRNTTDTQKGNSLIVTSMICGVLILLVLIGFVVLIYIRSHKVKRTRQQLDSLSISTIERSDGIEYSFGRPSSSSWSTVNNSQAGFFARLSLPSNHIVSPNRNLKTMNHPPILVQGQRVDMGTTLLDKRPEVTDISAYKSRTATLPPHATTRQPAPGRSTPYPPTPHAGIYRVVQQ